MEIWAKSNGISLRSHTEDLLIAAENLPYKKLDYNKLKTPEIDITQNFLKELLLWAVVFHDFGKVFPAFQKIIGNKNFTPQIPNFLDIRHNILSLYFINKDKIKELCKENESLYATFLSAIAFHHWKKDEKEYLLHINKDLREASRLLLQEKNGKMIGEILADYCP